jgi:iron complex transport system substrate-binding protein
MKTLKIFFFFITFIFTGMVFSQRVVSLAPAITEILFALGKGDTLVGVTKFCDYPPAALKIAKIGGFLDMNMEALLALAPEIVIAYPEQYAKIKFLGVSSQILVVKHQCLSDLFDSIFAIGRALHAEINAESMVSALKRKLTSVAAGAGHRKKIRTLIVAGRNADELKNMYIVGKNDFLNELLVIAGGVNAYQGAVNYPSIFLNPDLILEISAHYEGIGDEKVFALWSPFTMIPAVRNRQIKIIKESFWLRPGSRVGLIAEQLSWFFSSAVSAEKPASAD